MAGRADKFCYECAAVLPRTAVTCFACNAAQPDLPASAADAPQRPAAAEKICPSCGASILAQAEICVRCGVRQATPEKPAAPQAPAPSEPAASWDVSHAMLALGALLVVAMLVAPRSTERPAVVAQPSATPTPSATAPAGVTETDAWAAARGLVTEHLRAPPNVEFPSEHRTVRLGPERFEVTSYFEMANTSGKMVRTNWTVQLARVRGEWRVERLEARN